MWELIYLYIFLLSFLVSTTLVNLSRHLAIRFKILDRPNLRRKIHDKSMPLLGGLGMYSAFFTIIIFHMLAILLLEPDKLPPEISIHLSGLKTTLPQLITIFITSLILLGVGLLDDFRGLSAKLKFSIQFIMALCLFLAGIRINLFIDNTLISAILTITWIIGITNAFNLLDNMDGLSCGSALIASIIFFIVVWTSGQLFVATILACFIGVLLGFLRYNFPPAKIFMGDAGSLFIGYILSILTIISTYYTPRHLSPAPVIMPLVILAIPIFDTLSVIYIRLKKKVSIFTADKNHLSHRLVSIGMSKRQAVLFIYLVNFGIGLGALLLSSLAGKGCLIVLLQAVCILAIIVLLEKVKKCRD